MQPKYKAWYKDKMWKVETIYISDADADATRIRVGRINESGKYEWELPFKVDLDLLPFVGIDKNGQEIYGSDIVTYKHMGVMVEDAVLWDHARAGFEPFCGVVRGAEWIHVRMDFVEVIGNIYKNALQTA